jgi:hypothetical protein
MSQGNLAVPYPYQGAIPYNTFWSILKNDINLIINSVKSAGDLHKQKTYGIISLL